EDGRAGPSRLVRRHRVRHRHLRRAEPRPRPLGCGRTGPGRPGDARPVHVGRLRHRPGRGLVPPHRTGGPAGRARDRGAVPRLGGRPGGPPHRYRHRAGCPLRHGGRRVPAAGVERVRGGHGRGVGAVDRADAVRVRARDVGPALDARYPAAAVADVWRRVLGRSSTAEELAKGRDLSTARHREVWTALYDTAGCERLAAGLSDALYALTVSAESWEAFPDTLPTLQALHERG